MIYQPTFELSYGENQDLFLDSNNNISLIYDVFSVSQTVKNAISFWLGENQFDVTQGVDWSKILGEQLNRLSLNLAIQNSVLSVDYVLSIVSINYVTDDNKRVTSVTVKYLNTDNETGVANANF